MVTLTGTTGEPTSTREADGLIYTYTPFDIDSQIDGPALQADPITVRTVGGFLPDGRGLIVEPSVQLPPGHGQLELTARPLRSGRYEVLSASPMSACAPGPLCEPGETIDQAAEDARQGVAYLTSTTPECNPKYCIFGGGRGTIALRERQNWRRVYPAPAPGLPFYQNPAGRRVVDVAGAVEGAAATWNRIVPVARLSYRGTTDIGQVADDGRNVLLWREFEPSEPGDPTTVAAFAYYHIRRNDPDPIITVGCDIELNTRAPDWSTRDTQTDLVDLESVLVHEFGHCVGLDHPALPEDETQVMSRVTERGIGNRVLRDGDIAGARYLYAR